MKAILFSSLIFLTFSVNAQVGINTSDPQQELDVNGSVRSRDLTGGFIRAASDGTIENGRPNDVAYTPNTNGNSGLIPADALTFTMSNGNYVSPLTLPDAASSNTASRVGTFILIRRQAQLSFVINTTNTDLVNPLTVGANFDGQSQTAIFMFDGTRWVFIKTSN